MGEVKDEVISYLTQHPLWTLATVIKYEKDAVNVGSLAFHEDRPVWNFSVLRFTSYNETEGACYFHNTRTKSWAKLTNHELATAVRFHRFFPAVHKGGA